MLQSNFNIHFKSMQMRIRVVLIYLMIACCEKKKVTVFKHRQTFSLFNYQFDCFFFLCGILLVSFRRWKKTFYTLQIIWNWNSKRIIWKTMAEMWKHYMHIIRSNESVEDEFVWWTFNLNDLWCHNTYIDWHSIFLLLIFTKA